MCGEKKSTELLEWCCFGDKKFRIGITDSQMYNNEIDKYRQLYGGCEPCSCNRFCREVKPYGKGSISNMLIGLRRTICAANVAERFVS